MPDIRNFEFHERVEVLAAVLLRIHTFCDVTPCLWYVLPDFSKERSSFETSETTAQGHSVRPPKYLESLEGVILVATPCLTSVEWARSYGVPNGT
jgi:hypothetical protein